MGPVARRAVQTGTEATGGGACRTQGRADWYRGNGRWGLSHAGPCRLVQRQREVGPVARRAVQTGTEATGGGACRTQSCADSYRGNGRWGLSHAGPCRLAQRQREVGPVARRAVQTRTEATGGGACRTQGRADWHRGNGRWGLSHAGPCRLAQRQREVGPVARRAVQTGTEATGGGACRTQGRADWHRGNGRWGLSHAGPCRLVQRQREVGPVARRAVQTGTEATGGGACRTQGCADWYRGNGRWGLSHAGLCRLVQRQQAVVSSFRMVASKEMCKSCRDICTSSD